MVLTLWPLAVAANDYPTQARVEFVLGCMNEHGGQSYDTLYPCVCLIDRIADEMSYDEFAEAQVFAQLRSTPGERGGMFRGPERARRLTDKLESLLEHSQARCFVAGEPNGGASANASRRRGPDREKPKEAQGAAGERRTDLER